MLAVAQAFRDGIGNLGAYPQFDKWQHRTIALRDIVQAHVEQARIRNGEIDWNTGEPIARYPDKPTTVERVAPTPGTLAYAAKVQARMIDPTPQEGETEEQAKARVDYYRGYDDDGLPCD